MEVIMDLKALYDILIFLGAVVLIIIVSYKHWENNIENDLETLGC